MKLKHFTAAIATLVMTASVAQAQQVFLNEIYASHSGTDNMEFIELKGTPGLSLDNHVLLIVEGQSPSNGILDRVWDLSGTSVPTGGFYLAGGTAYSTTVGVDFDIGVSNRIENGTETFYLVDAGSPAGVAAFSALLGTDVSDPTGGGSSVTVIPTTASSNGGSVLDLVGMLGTNATVFIYDNAQVLGPDLSGPFFPAGVFRGLDHPNGWCTSDWLDFSPGGTDKPQTPRASNCDCDGSGCATGTQTFCNDADGALSFCPCSNPGASDTGCEIAQGTGGVLSTLTAQDTNALTATIQGDNFPPMALPTAIVIRANDQEATPVVFGDGLRCVGITGFARIAATAAVAGTSVHTFGHGVGTGTYYYQIWFRNTPASFCITTGSSSGAFNLSNGLVLDW